MHNAKAEAMTRAGAMPGAALSQPFGPDVEVWKVGGKIFAAITDDGVCVKCEGVAEARMLIDLGLAERAPYFHASWVRVPLTGAGAETIAARIAASYDRIRAGLPRALRATLG